MDNFIHVLLNALFNTIYICCWIYFLFTVFYDKYILPIKLNLETINKQHNNDINNININLDIINNTISQYDRRLYNIEEYLQPITNKFISTRNNITFPHFTVYSNDSHKNKVVSYQLAELLNIQPGTTMTKEFIYKSLFKYIKKHCSVHKNKILFAPKTIQQLFGNNTFITTLEDLTYLIDSHIKSV